MDLEDSANYAVQFSDRLDIVGLLKAMDVKYECILRLNSATFSEIQST